MRSILFEDRPCNYDLAYQSSPLAIIIRIQRQVAIRAALANPTSRLLQQKKERVKADDFCGQIAGPFGFNQILYPRVGNDNFVELEARLPITEAAESKDEHQLRMARLTATLQILFAHLNTQKVEVPEGGNHRQLLSVRVGSTEDTDRHAAMSATYSPLLYGWLNNFEQNHSFRGISKCMRTTYSSLCDYSKTNKLDFIAQIIRPYGYLQLSCPAEGGENCGIRPSDYKACRRSAERKNGCKVISYGLPSDIQQLTLLVGLARLNDIARQRMN